MKVVENEKMGVIDQTFRGLARDCDGSVWWFNASDNNAIVISASDKASVGYTMRICTAFEIFGPFTKFNGSITLEND